jgi:hypothetical protein
MIATPQNEPLLLSVHGASMWLKERGIRPYSRHTLYLAIAHRQLRIAASARRVTLIRRADLERYAAAVAASMHDKATKSA